MKHIIDEGLICSHWNIRIDFNMLSEMEYLGTHLDIYITRRENKGFKNRRYKMKKMIKKMNMVLAGVLGLVILGSTGANAGTAEYKNVMDLERFVANLGDSKDSNFCSREEKVFTAEKVVPGAEYRNIINLERFVANLEDPAAHEYRNIINLERFVTALGDPAAHEYYNVIDLARFVAALADPMERDYRNIIDLDRFVTALKDNKVDGESTEIACNDTANNYALADHEVKSGI